jgi:hypothetical protein
LLLDTVINAGTSQSIPCIHLFLIHYLGSRPDNTTSLHCTTSLQVLSTYTLLLRYINIMALSTQGVPTATVADGSEVAIPSLFICPITLQVMVDPLMTRSGLNFERAAIFSWLDQGSGSCPLTRNPLTASDLISNRRLKTRIRIWRANNGIPEPTEEEMAAVTCKFVSFLKISGDKKEEYMLARHSQLSTPMISALRTNIPAHFTPPSPSSPQRARQSGGRRRNFLNRMLTRV